MEAKDIRILNELIQNAEKIRLEKFNKYKDSWKTCDKQDLRNKLDKHTDELFFSNSLERQLRILAHIFNYTYFLWYRTKRILERET